MSFESYTALTTSIAGWIKRKDQQARIPDFIALFEARMNRVLRTTNQRKYAALNVYGGSVVLPDDFLEPIAIDDGTKGLDFMTTLQFGPSQVENGFYAIEAGSLLVSGDTGLVNLRYYARIPSLTADMPSNWVLANHPDAYLFGALTEAEPYLLNDARMQMWKDRGDTAIQGIQLADDQARFAGGTLAIGRARQ
ncbi:hypothetical protein CAL26_23720 [Bordetella genomosp. 9]|uniref:Uncharacterized protein n=1 Tax=Bordetella genomosp. 9 TaxID=1416803 RepID=A0A261R648_9BORD|nr:hypothetical protein [Bordetella genomosp. 9]OZI20506.1 hypothetical protein CAL26_23720 [Bordetella genomosp. 9]